MSAHVPCLGRTLDPDLVRTILDAAGTQFITVEFYRVKPKKGEMIARKNGRLGATSRLVGSERGQAQSERMAESGQVWLALPKGSASFYVDRVISITVKGSTVSVNN